MHLLPSDDTKSVLSGSEEMSRTRDKERSDYYGDTVYEVWRRGGDPDMVDYDRLDDCCYEGLHPDEAAFRELRRQSPRDGE